MRVPHVVERDKAVWVTRVGLVCSCLESVINRLFKQFAASAVVRWHLEPQRRPVLNAEILSREARGLERDSSRHDIVV